MISKLYATDISLLRSESQDYSNHFKICFKLAGISTDVRIICVKKSEDFFLPFISIISYLKSPVFEALSSRRDKFGDFLSRNPGFLANRQRRYVDSIKNKNRV